MADQDRAEFEAYIREVDTNNLSLEYSSTENRTYTNNHTENLYRTCIASRRTQSQQVRELVEAVEKLDALDRHHARSGVANYFAKMYAIRGRITTLAAQLKETP